MHLIKIKRNDIVLALNKLKTGKACSTDGLKDKIFKHGAIEKIIELQTENI